ncbi:MAG TPA: hypothetical protein PLL36_08515 [Candidatus Hydrogenedentes bacterium]|nr:hypothetical protein [Candidatus Hydrogenedentota bacterium]HQN01103.1 hypothetical protein [Candidatus Hydrogenedentota bacterium]
MEEVLIWYNRQSWLCGFNHIPGPGNDTFPFLLTPPEDDDNGR